MRRAASVLAVLLTPLLWPVGVVLLWLSPIWTTRAKILGTLVIPGGLALAVFLELGDRSSCELSTPPVCSLGPTYSLLHPADPAFNHVFGALVFLGAAVLPLGVAVYLAAVLRRRWADA